jgi:hypothetical protein
MYKNATKCNKTQSKWGINKHGASKIIDMFETYHMHKRKTVEFSPEADLFGPWFGQAGPSGGGLDRSGGAAKLVFWQGFRPDTESVRRAAGRPAYNLIRPKHIYFPEHFCYCFSSNLCILNTTNMD